jgi:hypothetical protein
MSGQNRLARSRAVTPRATARIAQLLATVVALDDGQYAGTGAGATLIM